MEPFAIVNGQFIPYSNASLLVTDLSIQRGYGVFDFFKTVSYKPVFLNDHLNRFYYSAQQMHLTMPVEKRALELLLHELIIRNKISSSGVKLTLTGGYSADGYKPGTPNLIITQQPLELNTPTLTKPLNLMTYEHRRQLPQVKSLDYMMAIWLQPALKTFGADEILYHLNNRVSECPRSNIFIVNKVGEVVTPLNGVLSGIIRKQLVQLSDSKYPVQERDITLPDLLECREAFITSTTRNVQPVVKVDNQIVGSGAQGEITTYFQHRLRGLMEQ